MQGQITACKRGPGAENQGGGGGGCSQRGRVEGGREGIPNSSGLHLMLC